MNTIKLLLRWVTKKLPNLAFFLFFCINLDAQVTFTPSQLTWSANETMTKYATVSVQGGGTWQADSTLISNHFSVSPSSGTSGSTVAITPLSTNTGSIIEGGLYVISTGNGGGALYLYHLAPPAIFSVSPEQLSWTYSETDSKSVYVSGSGWTSNIIGNGFIRTENQQTGTITVAPSGINTGSSTCSATLQVTNGTEYHNVSLTQGAYNNNGGNNGEGGNQQPIAYPDYVEWDAGDRTPKTVQVDAIGSWTLTDLTGGGHFYVSPWYGSGSGIVTITPLYENMGYVDMTEDFRFHDSVDTTYVMHLVHKRRFTDDPSDTTNTVFNAVTPASVDRLANADSLSSWLSEQSSHLELSGHDVGSIPVAESTSPTGGVTYSLSIPVAAGFKLTPGVTLAYNSQAGNGLAGYGWDIGGLSAITVIAKNRYYHGTNGAAEIEGTHVAWSLDGVPLLENQGPDYAATYPLVTARGRIFAKAHRDTSGVVSHFTVIYPDGTRAIYGWSTTTQPQAFYPITEKTDRLGNRITYEYAQPTDGGSEWRIMAIRYGYTTIGASSASIVFGYTGRTDKITKYYAGAKITNGFLLKSIASLSGADTLVRYSLSHKEAEDVNLLEKIECSDGDGHSLPPARFSYVTDECNGIPKGLLREYSKTVGFGLEGNGDLLQHIKGRLLPGKASDGVVSWKRFNRYTETEYGASTSYGSGCRGQELISIVPSTDTTSSFTLNFGSGFQTMEAVDVNGDGVDELVKINYGTPYEDSTAVIVTVISVNSSNSYSTRQFSFSIKGNRERVFPYGIDEIEDWTTHGPAELDYWFGDYDGDGKVDLAVMSSNTPFFTETPVSRFAVVDLFAGEKVYEGYLFSHSMGNIDNYRVLCADVDADGRTEIVRISGETPTIEVYGCTSMNGGFSLEHTWNILSSSAWGHHGPYITDVNGDGYLDFVVIPDNGTASALCYTGTRYEQRTLSGLQLTGSNSYVVFADVNRDGLVDALERLPGSSYMKVALNSNGTSFYSGDVRETEVWMSGDIVPFNIFDTYGTGGVVSIMGRFIAKYGFTRDRSLLRMIRCYSDGTGNMSARGYCNMMVSGEDGVYDEDYTRSYSLSDGYYKVAFPSFLLSSKAGKSSVQTISKARYKYGDAAFHRLGLGFCGFGALTEEDCIRQTVTRTMLDPEKFGVAIGQSTMLSGQQTPFSSSSYTYDNHVGIAGKADPRLTESVETDALTGIAATVSYSYDSYDLPVSTITERSVNGGDGVRSVTMTGYSNSVSSTLYLLGTPASVIETKGALASKTEYTLDSLKRPTRTKAYTGTVSGGNTAWHLTSDRIVTYDAHGNVTSDRTAAYGATTYNESTYTYDNTGRYLTTSTDPLGRTTTYECFTKYGKPATVYNWLTQETDYGYDAWGRQIYCFLPDGTDEYTSYAWSASGEPGLYCITKTVTGKPDTKVWYDALGREVRSANKRFDGSWQYVTTEYDGRGRLARTSLPYKNTATGPTLWNTYKYDSYNRPIRLSEASGKQTTWSYSGTSTTMVKDSLVTTSTTDAEGNVVRVSDVGGTIDYALRDDGQPSAVILMYGTAPNQQIVTTTFQYDNYGRRTAIVDPSAGTRTDTYTDNADGSSSVAHTGPNGTVTTYYDRFGRVTSVIRPEFNSINTYGTDPYSSSYGKLLSVASTNGTSRSFTYDGYGRPLTETEYADSTNWLRRTYTYGAGSNVVASINYTTQDGSITTETFSYANGHNTAISATGSGNATFNVFTLTGENPLGQPTAATTGSAVRAYSYTSTGIPSGRQISDVENTTVQNFSYSYAPISGNMLSRADNVMSIQELFNYDAQNRLLCAMESWEAWTPMEFVYENAATTFNSKGNITSRTYDGMLSLNITYGNSANPYEATSADSDDPMYSGYSYTMVGPSITTTSFDRPASVAMDPENPNLTYKYNASGEKAKMTVNDDGFGVHMNRYYLGGVYEKDENTGDSRSENAERLFLGGTAYDAPMVLVKTAGVNEGAWTPFNIGRDVQGSITEILTADGEIVERFRYDPWGVQLCSAPMDTCAVMPADDSLAIGEGIAIVDTLAIPEPWQLAGLSVYVGSHGYTGHEHIYGLGIINCNARLYDPVLGRFLAPDPLIQDPASTQNFNRYSYCLNNPLKYTDESGEVIGTLMTAFWRLPFTFIASGFQALINGIKEKSLEGAWNGFKDEWKQYGKRVANAAKIDLGYFKTDSNKSVLSNLWTIVSRFTLELPQTRLGNLTAHLRNNLWRTNVDYYQESTLVNRDDNSYWEWGFTLGSYINGKNLVANPDINGTFAHEYGHVKQSKYLGRYYITIVGIPSLVGTGLNGVWRHDHHSEWYEVWANQLANNYYLGIGDTAASNTLQVKNSITKTSYDWYDYVTLWYYLQLRHLPKYYRISIFAI